MNQQSPSPQQAGVAMKVIWAAMLGGVLMIAVVFPAIVVPFNDPEADRGIWLIVAITLLVAGVAFSYIAKQVLIRYVWQDGQFNPPAYALAMIIPLAILDGFAVAILVLTVVVESFMPIGIAALVLIGFMAMHFPRSPEFIQNAPERGQMDR